MNDSSLTLDVLQQTLQCYQQRVDDLQATQNTLQTALERYRALFDHAPIAHYLLDKNGLIIESNLAGNELLQEAALTLVHRPMQRYIAKANRKAFSQYLVNASVDRISTLEVKVTGRKSRSMPVQLYLIGATTQGEAQYYLAAVDVCLRQRTEKRIQMTATVFEESSDGVMITDANGTILHVNPAFTVVTGYLGSEVMGKNASKLSSGRHNQAFFASMWKQLSHDGHWQGEIWNKRKNGEIYPEWLKITTLYGEDKQVHNRVGIFKDLSELHTEGGIYEHFAFYDMLTGLPNRILFTDRLKHALIRAQRDQKQTALLYLDLDRFKQVNDSLGHQTGDLLLRDVANRLAQRVRINDTLARLGGDEFAVIVADLDSLEHAQDICQRIATQICEQLTQAFQIGVHEIIIGCSVGIAYFPQHGQTYSELVKYADVAMYRAKSDGGNRFVTFSQDMSEQLQYRLILQGAVRDALRRDELYLVYQPIINATSHSLIGLEVLLRWNGPRGPVSPVDIVPLCEELGLGAELANWVVRRACLELQSMPFWQHQPLWFSINIAPHVLCRNHIHWLAQVLLECDMPASRLVVEITEEHLRFEPEAALKTLNEIRTLGARVAIDDFGAGYCSLARLRNFPVDILKIDRSFMGSLSSDSTDLAIIITIITLAHQLKLDLLAAGVETHQQVELLMEKGCTNIQGHIVAHPMTSADCIAWATKQLATSH